MTAPGPSFGLLVPTLMEFEPCGMDRMREAAELGDQYFDVLWVGDHLIYRSPILDATVSVALLGSLTTSVRVGTNVLQLPLRRPLDVAKSFSTISHLFEGRVILGIGIGGEFAPEWEAAGISTRERGARCDEAIDMLHWLWDGQAKEGTYGMSPGIPILPSPDGGRVPIWVGGRADAAIRRAARCDGAINIWVSPDRCRQIQERVAELRPQGTEDFTFALELLGHVDDVTDVARGKVREALVRLGLDPDALERYTAFGTPDQVAERVVEYVRAGVQHISFYLPGEGWSVQARRIAEEVLPRVRDAVQVDLSAAG